jgi:hypothetical protein
MSELNNTIANLASEFAEGVLAAIRSASLEELLQESGNGAAKVKVAAAKSSSGSATKTKGDSSRLERRSDEDINKVVHEIVNLLSKHPDGLRSEQIRAELNLSPKELPRPIAQALDDKVITKKGEKRATTYFTKGNSADAKPKAKAKVKTAADAPSKTVRAKTKSSGKKSNKSPKRSAKRAPKKADGEMPLIGKRGVKRSGKKAHLNGVAEKPAETTTPE